MALQCGIVGLPNVGKSTLFNCLSNAKAQSANFPFCTIEPNVGVITVPDERLNKLAEIEHPHYGGNRRHRWPCKRCQQRGRAGKQIPRQYPRNRCNPARITLFR